MRRVRHFALILAAAFSSPAISADALAAKGRNLKPAQVASTSSGGKRRPGSGPRTGPRPTTRPFVRQPARHSPKLAKLAEHAARKRLLAEQHDAVAVAVEADAAQLDKVATTAEGEAERLAGQLMTATSTLAELRAAIRLRRDERDAVRRKTGGNGRKRARRARALLRAEHALATAELAATGAEVEVVRLTGEAPRARGQAGAARTVAREATKLAVATRTRAERAKRSAEQAEAEAGEAAQRRDQRKGNRDQHAVHVAQQDAGRRALYLQAVKKTRTWSMIEPKPGEVSQDAVAAAPELGLFAIADGVTNSSFSGEFARALVRRWTETPPKRLGEFARWMAGAQAEWTEEVGPKIAGLRTSWYNRSKVFQGDAAFVGAKLFRNGERRQLHLMGIGDTVALLVRGGKLKQSFPLVEAHEFSNEVKALPSVGDAPFKVRDATWDVKPGDEVFMATDALAAWLFTELESGRDPFPRLRALRTTGQMRDFVVRARAGDLPDVGEMSVDDTTLARFVVPVT